MVIMSKEWMTIVMLGHYVVVLVVMIRGLWVLVAEVMVRLRHTSELRASGEDTASDPLNSTPRLKASTPSIP